MKKSFKEILGKSDPDMIGYAVDSMKDDTVSEDTIARIQNRVTGMAAGKKRSIAIRKWIPVVSAAACFIVVFGVLFFTGALKRMLPIQTDPGELTDPTGSNNPDVNIDPPDVPVIHYLYGMSALKSRADYEAIEGAAEDNLFEPDTSLITWNGLTVWKSLADALDNAEDETLFAVVAMLKEPDSPYKNLWDFYANDERSLLFRESEFKIEILTVIIKAMEDYKDHFGSKGNYVNFFRPVLSDEFGNETTTQYFKSGKLDFLREYLADGIFQDDLLRQDYDYLCQNISDFKQQYKEAEQVFLMSYFVDGGFLSRLCYRLGITGYTNDDSSGNIIVISKGQLKSMLQILEEPDQYANIKPEDIDSMYFAWAYFDNGATRGETENPEVPMLDND